MTRQNHLEPQESLPCTRPDLGSSLARWGELEPGRQSELGAHAERCPRCGPALALMLSVDSWLEERIDATADDGCPSGEELYRYGRGPGAEALSEERRAALGAHLAACAHCEALIETLADRPPSPLILEPPRDDLASTAPRRPGGLRLVGALLAVAASVTAAVLLFNEARAGAPRIVYPEAPLLRGEGGNPLYFPRERVLAAAAGGLHSKLLFELAPQQDASGYVVYLERHAGGAFDAGERVATVSGASPVLALPDEQRAGLRPGHYTWEAWAVVNGLDQPLGRRDFEVVQDPALLARIERLAARAEPERSEGILALLYPIYPSDARAFARALPASPEREAFLARVPGR